MCGVLVQELTWRAPHKLRHLFSEAIGDAWNDGGGLDHSDGLGEQSSNNNSYVVIDNNTIASAGNTQAIAYQESGPFMDGGVPSISQ